MQNFRNLGASEGGGDHFLTRQFEEKERDTTKSHREVIFHLFAGNSPLSQIYLKFAYE